MDNKDKNAVDKFLDKYEEITNKRKKKYIRIYEKPSKFNAIVGFVFSTAIFVILIRLFTFKFYYFVFLLFDICVVFFYGVNLFSKKGIGLPKTIFVPKEYEEEVFGESESEDEDK